MCEEDSSERYQEESPPPGLLSQYRRKGEDIRESYKNLTIEDHKGASQTRYVPVLVTWVCSLHKALCHSQLVFW